MQNAGRCEVRYPYRDETAGVQYGYEYAVLRTKCVSGGSRFVCFAGGATGPSHCTVVRMGPHLVAEQHSRKEEAEMSGTRRVRYGDTVSPCPRLRIAVPWLCSWPIVACVHARTVDPASHAA